MNDIQERVDNWGWNRSAFANNYVFARERSWNFYFSDKNWEFVGYSEFNRDNIPQIAEFRKISCSIYRD